MNKATILILAALCWSCANNSPTEKHQRERDNIINVKDRIREIVTDPVYIGSNSVCMVIDSFLMIKDYKSPDMILHLFNKNTFRYITSAIPMGQGPGEIVNIGHIEVIDNQRRFYVNDHGKQRIFSYDLDSILANPRHIPEVKMIMDNTIFPSGYEYINDTLNIGLIIEPIGNSDFSQSVAGWNMTTGTIAKMSYTHPDIKKKRVAFAASKEHGIYVECYGYYDLISICDFDGNLKYNIYGRHWNKNPTGRKIGYSESVIFCKDRIVTLYSGKEAFIRSENGEIKANWPTKIMIFDISGDYIQTLETGYNISRFCYDEENNRLILSFDDEIQFGYLNLDGLISS
ncbi:MAG: TolB-like 6-bladed beta-propeller domain-containing protein [Tannerellaceae bacterium]|jgi:hypothetical protein|nr:TolB-like 6-bladed beta-propeller domain-containing protein [Tannerellaceae bacterium]